MPEAGCVILDNNSAAFCLNYSGGLFAVMETSLQLDSQDIRNPLPEGPDQRPAALPGVREV